MRVEVGRFKRVSARGAKGMAIRALQQERQMPGSEMIRLMSWDKRREVGAVLGFLCPPLAKPQATQGVPSHALSIMLARVNRRSLAGLAAGPVAAARQQSARLSSFASEAALLVAQPGAC